MNTSLRYTRWSAHCLAGVCLAFLTRPLPLNAQAPDLKVRAICTLTHEQALMMVATMSRDGKLIASGSLLSGVRIWDVDTAKALRNIPHSGQMSCLCFSPDGKRLAIGGEGPIRIVSVATGKDVARIPNFQTTRTTCLAFLPSGKGILAGVTDLGEATIRAYDATTGKELRNYKGHAMGVTSIALSQDAKRFVSSGLDKTVRLWEVSKPKEIRRFEGHTGMVQDAALTPDGKRVLSGAADKTLRVWDANTGEQLAKMDEPIGSVNGVAFLPGGQYGVSGGGGEFEALPVGGGVQLKSILGKAQAVRLWSLNTGKELTLFSGPEFAVSAVAVSANGRRVFAATSKGTLHVWELPETKTLP